MAEDKEQERTEPATPKKREEARRKGIVARSREIPSVLVMLGALSVFYFVGESMFDQMRGVAREIFLQVTHGDLNAQNTQTLMWHVFAEVAALLAPLVIAVALAAGLGNIAQVGLLLTGEPLSPRFTRLDPIEGIRRLFSTASLAELIKSIFKMIIIGSIGYSILRREMDQIHALVAIAPDSMLSFVQRVALKLGYYSCLALIVLAGLDYVFQHWKHERDLRMTKQEIKDEVKQREGDPLIRSRIRSAQREMAMRDFLEAVPEATLVITGHPQLAIAIQYAHGMPAPLITAKGERHIAERICEIAGSHDIPVIEQPSLARALNQAVQIGQYVPVDLHQAVAEVLAYVYRLKGLAHTEPF